MEIGTSEWHWGCDIFWLSYIAVYPTFPEGDWPRWSPLIPLDGQFIHEWMDGVYGEDHIVLMNSLWKELLNNARLFYPYALVT